MSTLQELISSHRRIVFFGGAGVSTESGIPDFRSTDGLYNQEYAYPPETILSHSFWKRYPEEFYRFYSNKMLYLDAQPNAAHRKLAEMEQKGILSAVITQNIDGLHQKAGSRAVFELHGSVHRNRCVKCGEFFDAHFILHSAGIPRCECGGIVKPEVVLYEEPLDEDVLEGAVRRIANSDLLIIGGTSLAVHPAAGLLGYFSGDAIVQINRDPTPYDDRATLSLHEPIGQVLGKIVV